MLPFFRWTVPRLIVCVSTVGESLQQKATNISGNISLSITPRSHCPTCGITLVLKDYWKENNDNNISELATLQNILMANIYDLKKSIQLAGTDHSALV